MKRIVGEDSYEGMIEELEERGDFSLTQKEYLQLASSSARLVHLAERFSRYQLTYLHEQMPDEIWVPIFRRLNLMVNEYFGHLLGGKLDSLKKYNLEFLRGRTTLAPTAEQHWDQLRGIIDLNFSLLFILSSS